jgi:multiple sugar transport system substrate-binding protein
MASNESPDLIELSTQDIPSYSANGVLEDLSAKGSKSNFDFSIFSNSAKAANSVNGSYYALPYATDIIQMFYNKDLLAQIGATEPPKTMEELYDMAVKATKLDAKGNIDILGYPLFPLASARQEGIYAFGGTWVDSETGKKPTANSQGVLDSLNMNVKYRSLYGIDKVQKFVATSNTNRYTPQDIFFAGKQLFRFDGTWLAKMIKDNNPKINYGVTMIPGTKANPELRGVSRYENTSVAIPTAAVEKDGAFALAQYLVTDGAKGILMGIGSLPANKNLYEDKELLGSNDCFPQFIDALKADNGVQYPKMEESSKYTSLIEESLDYVYNGVKTPKDAMDALEEQASALK